MAGLTPEQKALLDAIAGPESRGQYDIIYGGDRFEDFSDHPGEYKTITSGPNKGKKSSAAGKYQFLESTWDDIAAQEGLTDFSPQSQDTAALALARRDYKASTGRSLDSDLSAGELERIAKGLSGTWTSLPSGIEQGTTTSRFANAYNSALNTAQVNDIAGRANAAVSPNTALGKLQQLFGGGMDAARGAGGGFLNAFAAQTQRPEVRSAAVNAYMNTPLSASPGSRTPARPHMTSAPDRTLQYIMARPDISRATKDNFDPTRGFKNTVATRADAGIPRSISGMGKYTRAV